MDSSKTATQGINTTLRKPEPCEFIPQDFFAPISVAEIFGQSRACCPLEIDLGCGDGKFALEMAAQFPERNFLAVERLLGRVRKVCKFANRLGLNNLRVLRLDSRYTLEWLMPAVSISQLHLLCPDPWPKAKHESRRIIQPEFLTALHRALVPDGEFLFKTDYLPYFEWTLEHVEKSGLFAKLDWPETAFFYPKTDFQLQWEAEGLTINRARFRKLS